MPGRMLFKEKQLRLCVVAALTSLTAPVAGGLLLPPKPLSSNQSWNCHPGSDNPWLCRGANALLSIQTQATQTLQKPARSITSNFQPSSAAGQFARNPQSALSQGTSPSESAVLMELLNSPDNNYVLQWMAARERDQLEAMKQRYPVLHDATIAQYRRSGKDWFMLLDGPYPSRMAAISALDAPPRSQMARELYPWTRSLASIQQLDIIVPESSQRQLAMARSQQGYNSRAQASAEQNTTGFAREYGASASYSPEGYAQEVTASQNPLIPATPQPSWQPEPAQLATLPYGQEFDNSRYNSYPPGSVSGSVTPDQSTQEMYVSITPAYRSHIKEQYQQESADYNVQDTPPQPEQEPDPYSRPSPRPGINVLTANPLSYTIEWMAGSRKASLERAKLRYSELQDTQIIHYRRNNRNRFVLVSRLFVNRSDALDALLTPSFYRVSARFSPRVRQVGDLQALVGSTPQPSQFRAQTREDTSTRRALNNYSPERDLNWENPAGTRNVSASTWLVNNHEPASSQEPDLRQAQMPATEAAMSPINTHTGYERENPTQYQWVRHQKPVLQSHQPVIKNQQQVIKSHQPVSNNYQSVSNNYQSVSNNYQPVSNNYQSVSNNYQPVSNNHQSVSNNYQPVSNNHQSVSNNYQPVSNNYQPVSNNHQPVSNNHQPVSNNHQPVSNNHQPVSNNHQPVSNNSRSANHQRANSSVVSDKQAMIPPSTSDEQKQLYAYQPESLPLKEAISAEHILNSPEKSYTIQWFSANNPESIQRLRERFPELSSAVTLKMHRGGKDWYVLVQGQFRSSKEAIAAIKSPAMKHATLVLHPWTRPVNSLKKLQIASR